jgi:hypothetical protein
MRHAVVAGDQLNVDLSTILEAKIKKEINHCHKVTDFVVSPVWH